MDSHRVPRPDEINRTIDDIIQHSFGGVVSSVHSKVGGGLYYIKQLVRGCYTTRDSCLSDYSYEIPKYCRVEEETGYSVFGKMDKEGCQSMANEDHQGLTSLEDLSVTSIAVDCGRTTLGVVRFGKEQDDSEDAVESKILFRHKYSRGDLEVMFAQRPDVDDRVFRELEFCPSVSCNIEVFRNFLISAAFEACVSENETLNGASAAISCVCGSQRGAIGLTILADNESIPCVGLSAMKKITLARDSRQQQMDGGLGCPGVSESAEQQYPQGGDTSQQTTTTTTTSTTNNTTTTTTSSAQTQPSSQFQPPPQAQTTNSLSTKQSDNTEAQSTDACNTKSTATNKKGQCEARETAAEILTKEDKETLVHGPAFAPPPPTSTQQEEREREKKPKNKGAKIPKSVRSFGSSQAKVGDREIGLHLEATSFFTGLAAVSYTQTGVRLPRLGKTSDTPERQKVVDVMCCAGVESSVSDASGMFGLKMTYQPHPTPSETDVCPNTKGNKHKTQDHRPSKYHDLLNPPNVVFRASAHSPFVGEPKTDSLGTTTLHLSYGGCHINPSCPLPQAEGHRLSLTASTPLSRHQKESGLAIVSLCRDSVRLGLFFD